MSAYIKLSTLEYPRHIGDIEIDPIGMEDFSIVQWVDRPEYNNLTQLCYEGIPEYVDNIWKITWVVRDATQEELDIINQVINSVEVI